VDQEREGDGTFHGVLDAVAGLADAQDVAGIGERLLDDPPGGVPGDEGPGAAARSVVTRARS
jgi:hypothetical protein